MLTTTPPAFSAEDVMRAAFNNYGIRAQTRPLVSERDQNFLLDADDGKRYTLKISNSAEQLQVIDFQNKALLHVANQDPSFPLPRVIPGLNGQRHFNLESGGKTHFVRVFSWVEGRILDELPADAALTNRLGGLLARLGLALKGFDHPGSNPPSLWDMKRAAGLADLLDYIEEPGLRRLVSRTLDRFVKLKPELDTLRTQVIHNDMSRGNVVMDKTQSDQISGIIDFGDMTRSPLIIDLAVAAAYQLSDGDDPLSGALPMITGYHAIRPLQNLEMVLLTDLIRTRLITSLLVNSYRVTLFPENREYLMISRKPAINFLTGLERLSTDDALERIETACTFA